MPTTLISSITARFAPLAAAAGVVLAAVAPPIAAAEAQPGRSARDGQSLKVLRLPMRTDGPNSLDPAVGSSVYDNMATAQIYETLLEFSYADPNTPVPLLLEQMPTSEDGGVTWHFRLKQGVRFHDNPCFPGGEGRELIADDIFYSWKRLVDEAIGLRNEWLFKGTIKGYDKFQQHQRWRVFIARNAQRLADASEEQFRERFEALLAPGAEARGNDRPSEEIMARLVEEFARQPAPSLAAARFDYDAEVPGFVKLNDHEFKIILEEPVYRFLYVLTMFQTAIVPREAVEYYGANFDRNPVGTGPFVFEAWTPKDRMSVNRNPRYHDVRYPAADEWSREDRRNRLHRAAGQRVPFVDRIEFTMFVQDQPMWLQFREGNLDYTEVPEQYMEQAFDRRTQQLLPELGRQGIREHIIVPLHFIFHGFNMEDELVGGYTPEKRALRQAIHLAIDLNEINQVFYNSSYIVYDGPIPPGLDGHPEGGTGPISWRGPRLELARQKLAEAGYPEGRGLPPIRYYTSRGGVRARVVELVQRQLAEIGVRVEPHLVDFSELIRITNRRQAPMFHFAWITDYPDGENNLALFYGPNSAPGSNHFNYNNPEYDRLYEKIRTMPPSEERTAIYEQMRDMVLEDTPYVGSMASTRRFLINPWLLNAKPTERYWGWIKFLDLDESRRR